MLAIDDHMKELLAIPGARSVSLVDHTNDRVMARRGHDPAAVPGEAAGTAAVIRVILETEPFAHRGREADLEDVVLTTRSGYVLVAVVRGSPGPRTRCHIQLRLDRTTGNLALARRAIRRLARRLAAESTAELLALGRAPSVPMQRRRGHGPDTGGAPSTRTTAGLPVRQRDPDRPARGADGVRWTPPDRATLERVLGALRGLYASSPRAGVSVLQAGVGS
ncbi:hypothetical protein [Marinitenerispora sediminis]|uniref:Uncharacterized protein n=1 Tax=Marinitenerispora sediminis TaxID=1931232 RepID=A0A368T446_9ACTN|nr:hypothetical protein [Marinitenerispora sediminis]RCV53166.1 hypothetical protein DEF28_11025 [Marinitenerispora sediminis]RCV53707.1 hypothetical protein DEF23_17105 [Marinitenerispora sediminis]RCV58030.1 hypothetical protein DEF24_14270 [Marinitenerispora sediminis]